MRPVRIVQLANFYGPRSGGLRTAVHHLGAGYAAHGHEVVLVVPGPAHADNTMPSGVRRIALPGVRIPRSGGYHVVDPRQALELLQRLRPDRIEVSDRLTLRGLGRWAATCGVPSVMIAHERLDRLLHQFLLPDPAARWLADRANRHTAASYDTVVCTTHFARAEFDRVGARNVVRIPLGVDLDTFSPCRQDAGLRAELAPDADAMLVHCGRLSPEKHVEGAIDALAKLREAGKSVRLVIAGDGPRRAALQRRAAGLPITFLGFVSRRTDVAKLLASSDVSLAPGPHEGLLRCARLGQAWSLIPVGQIARVSSSKAARTRRFTVSSTPSS